MLTKTVRTTDFKADAEGVFEATISTFDTPDHDGDVTLAEAFAGEQGKRIPVASFGHNWGTAPVGVARIYADRRRAWVVGQFNLATVAGREHYETAKQLGTDGQWSYGFTIVDSSFGDHKGRRVRYLKALRVHECCQVLAGAGIATTTQRVKAGGLPPALREELLLMKQSLELDLRLKRARELRVFAESKRVLAAVGGYR